MSNNTLYIVSTYYHTLITCIKQLAHRQNADILVTEYIPQYEVLAERLRICGLFRKVITSRKIDEYVPKNLPERIFLYHQKNAALIRSQLDVDIREYNDIFIFHDDIWAAHYLKSTRTRYHLIEDALDSFKTLPSTRFAFMSYNNTLRSAIKRAFHIGYVYGGYDRYTINVEVNSAEGIKRGVVCRRKMVECPRSELFCRLTDEGRSLLRSVFMNRIPDISGENSMLLLTSPLLENGIVSTEEEQAEIIMNAAERNSSRLMLIVKPHPIDRMDYSKVFPGAVILDRYMPVELLTLVCGLRFAKVVSFGSTSTKSIIANEYITEEIP